MSEKKYGYTSTVRMYSVDRAGGIIHDHDVQEPILPEGCGNWELVTTAMDSGIIVDTWRRELEEKKMKFELTRDFVESHFSRAFLSFEVFFSSMRINDGLDVRSYPRFYISRDEEGGENSELYFHVEIHEPRGSYSGFWWDVKDEAWK